MDEMNFDRLARSFTDTSSRRGLLSGLTATAFGLAVMSLPGSARTNNRKKSNSGKKKPAFNQFGCLDIGQKCRGRDANCCSGVCQGKKPEKGKRDRSICVAHDEGGCQAEQDFCADPLTSVCPDASFANCFRTTGAASFCGAGAFTCAACAKDADCLALDIGKGACVVCSGCPDGTACVTRDS